MDNTTKFTGRASAYAQARPSYATEFFEYLTNTMGISKDSVFADIGSGTGKFSKQILEIGCKVFCVEPNADMRKEAEHQLSGYKGFISVNGTDEGTTINAETIDYITVAQAFHWFNPIAFRQECLRILKKVGKVILIWNTKRKSEMVIEHDKLCSRFCPEFKGFSGGLDSMNDTINTFFNHKYELIRFNNDIYYNKEKFIQRALSASYALQQTDNNYVEFISSLESLFDKYSFNGTLVEPNDTVAYIGSVFSK